MDSVAVEVLLLAVCAALSAFFSGSETALTRLRPSAAKEMARRGGLVGAAVWRLAESPTRVISTILVGNNIVNTAMSALATVILVRELGEERGVLAATAATTVGLLILGEITPKNVAALYPEAVARAVAIPLYVVRLLLAPAVAVLDLATKPLVRLIARGRPAAEAVSAGEVRALARRLAMQGGRAAEEAEIVAMVLEAGETVAADIMHPRGEIFHLDEATTAAQAFEQFNKLHYSRAPVSRGGVDGIEGFVHLKDVAARLASAPETPLRDLARPILRVPRTLRVLGLLREMQDKLTHMAVVLDEFGGTVGLVTTEDCVEEIVGEIRDEYDQGEFAAIEEAGPGVWRALGRVRAVDFTRETGVSIPADRGSTLGGILFNDLQRKVQRGDSAEAGGVRITALEVSGVRVLRVKVERLGGAPAAGEAP